MFELVPNMSQIEMNSTRVQSRSRFQDLFENQVFIVGTAEERLAHSVEGKTEIAGEITIRDVNVDIVSGLA